MSDRFPAMARNATVLVIDPSPGDRAQICECLNQLPDLRIIAVGEAEHALQAIREANPSLVLLDSTQKGMDGIALTRAIRGWEQQGGNSAFAPWTPIVFLSSIADEDLLAQGICQGGQPVMSFNFGAGKKSRVKEAFRFQLLLCSCYTCLFWLLMMLAPGAVAGIFTSDTALIDYTTWSMRIYMAGIFAMGFQIACQQSFMALGQAKVSLLLACLRKIILLIPLIFLLPHLVIFLNYLVI
jgi:CheY-like chemotaxis protein